MSRSEIVNLTLAREAKSKSIKEIRLIRDEENRRARKARADASFPLDVEPTRRQLEVLTFMRRYLLENGIPATLREIMVAIDVHSPNGVNCHLQSLRKKGLIRSAGHGKSRGWVPTVDEGCCPACARPLNTKE